MDEHLFPFICGVLDAATKVQWMTLCCHVAVPCQPPPSQVPVPDPLGAPFATPWGIAKATFPGSD